MKEAKDMNCEYSVMWLVETVHVWKDACMEEEKYVPSGSDLRFRATVGTLKCMVRACYLVGADPSAVVATVKAVDRHNRRVGKRDYGMRWRVDFDTVRRAWAVDSDAPYWKSTGRRKNWLK